MLSTHQCRGGLGEIRESARLYVHSMFGLTLRFTYCYYVTLGYEKFKKEKPSDVSHPHCDGVVVYLSKCPQTVESNFYFGCLGHLCTVAVRDKIIRCHLIK